MKNEKYLVIEKEILERLILEMTDKFNKSDNGMVERWLAGNINALKTIKDYCKPLDETI
jgi:hypothetical protein